MGKAEDGEKGAGDAHVPPLCPTVPLVPPASLTGRGTLKPISQPEDAPAEAVKRGRGEV